jgi:hypothetical protein
MPPSFSNYELLLSFFLICHPATQYRRLYLRDTLHVFTLSERSKFITRPPRILRISRLTKQTTTNKNNYEELTTTAATSPNTTTPTTKQLNNCNSDPGFFLSSRQEHPNESKSLPEKERMSAFTRVADFAQRGMVLGLFSVFSYQAYQIGRNIKSGIIEHPTMNSTYFKDVEEKVKEEYKNKDNAVDTRDWYEENDDSYLKDQVRPNINTPEFKKEYKQRKNQS